MGGLCKEMRRKPQEDRDGKGHLGAVTQGEELLHLILCVQLVWSDEVALKQTGAVWTSPPTCPARQPALCCCDGQASCREKIDKLNNVILWQ